LDVLDVDALGERLERVMKGEHTEALVEERDRRDHDTDEIQDHRLRIVPVRLEDATQSFSVRA
jgi:hypothetical protein